MNLRSARNLRPLITVALLAGTLSRANADPPMRHDDSYPGMRVPSARAGAVTAQPGALRTAPAATVKSASALTALRPPGPRIGALSNSFVPPADSLYLLSSNGFQDLNGNCNDRGWVGIDRTAQLFTHIDNAYTVNQAFYSGETRLSLFTPPTSPIATTALRSMRGLALTDSGTLIFADILSNPSIGRTLYELYPSRGFIRVFGTANDPNFLPGLSAVVFDPSTGGIVAFSIQDSSGKIFRFPRGGGLGTLIAGNNSGSTADGPGLASFLGISSQIGVDNAGNIYFTETVSNRVRVLHTNGQVVTIAGTGTPGYSGDNGPGLSAQLSAPFGCAVDLAGTALWVIDQNNTVIRRIDLASGIITSILGNPGVIPLDIVPDGSNLLIGSASTPTTDARIVRLSGTTLTTLTGGGRFAKPSVPLLGTELDVIDARGIMLDGSGGFYFIARNQREIFHQLANGTVQLVAGVPQAMTMGNRALRIGADMTTDPAIVKDWVRPSGYGNGWSQRLISPTFTAATHPNAVLSFDAWMDLDDDSDPSIHSVEDSLRSANEFIVVEARTVAGTWVPLTFRYQSQNFGQGFNLISSIYGRDMLKFTVLLGSDGNESVVYDTPTQLRVVVQTNSFASSEDGVTPVSVAAAILDNVTLRDGSTDLVAPVDFEDNSMHGWTVAALNGAYGPAAIGNIRDVALPANHIQLSQNFDFADSSCAWTFTSARGFVEHGTYASLQSPWMALAPGDNGLTIAFSGKLTTTNEAKLLNVIVRGKNAGDTHPRGSLPSNTLLNAGTDGGDNIIPFVHEVTLRYPNDFLPTIPVLTTGPGISLPSYDSLQVVFQVEDRADQFGGQDLTGAVDTRYPMLDDIRFYQVGVDQDFDGVANANDACASTSGAGQDADGNGCPDPTSTMHHVESWAASSLPLHFRLSQNGSPAITDGSDLTAIRTAFQTWQTVPGSDLSATEDAPTTQKQANPLDQVNLVTFEDSSYPFSPSVLAVTPTMSFTRRAALGDQIVLPGQIVDSDMLFNPQVSFKTGTHIGDWDLLAVTTHEAGHFYGLSHSGVRTATMFFVQQPGAIAGTLKNDDMSAIAAAYPGATLQTMFGTIKGSVVRDTSGLPVPGALITAVRLNGAGAPLDTVGSDYTREDGSYAIYRLPPGNYGIHLQALDGSVLEGLTPEFISQRLLNIAQTNFDPEWYSIPEGVADDPNAKATLTLGAGQTLTAINIVTNLDTIPPLITGVTPGNGNTGVAIDATVALAFSEAVDIGTLSAALRVHPQSSTTRLAGSALLANHGKTLLFTPDVPLDFSTTYVVDLTTALTDTRGVHLAAPFTSAFTSQDAPPLAITGVQPHTVPVGGLITITGQGFTAQDSILVEFKTLDVDGVAVPVSITAGTIVAQVPAITVGADSVYLLAPIIGQSNKLALSVVAPPPQSIPTNAGAPIPLSFTPSGVALSNDGTMAYVVGDGGFVTINLDTSQPNFRVPVSHLTQASQRVKLTPDGTRAVISQPGAKDLLIVDASRSSGTFGVVQDTIATPGSPADFTISPTGQKAYITDPANLMVHAADLRVGNPVAGEIVRSYPVVNPSDGPIAIHPDGASLILGGLAGAQSLRLSDGQETVLNAIGIGGPIAVNPTGTQFFAPGSSGNQLAAASTNPTTPPSLVGVGGQLRDVVVSLFGQSAFAVNGALNQLQVVDISPGSPTYHTVVGGIATGAGPAALAISGNGNLIAVANGAGHSISLYNTGLGGGPVLSGVVPNVAMPGDQVVTLNGGTTTTFAGASVDLGLGLTPVTRGLPAGASFVAPTSFQRAANLTVQLPDNTRSLSLPFQIVNPIVAPFAKPTGRTFPLFEACGGTLTGPVDWMKVSPDGRFLAIHKQPSGCTNNFDLFEIAENGPHGFGSSDGNVLNPTGASMIDFAFTADGKKIWTINAINGARVLDVDPASPTFTQTLQNLPPTIIGSPAGIIADPLGRRMIISGSDVSFYRLDGSKEMSVAGFTSSRGIAITPDGHRLIVGGSGNAMFFDVDQEILITSSPVHTGSVDRITVTSDGRRAFGIFSDGSVSVWIMDPSLGAFGTETFHGMLGVGALQSPIPGVDGHSVLCASATTGANLVKLDLSFTPPAAVPQTLPQPAFTLQRSADGRRLFAAKWVDVGGSQAADVQMYSFANATQLSLVSGDQQTAPAGTTLPIPVDVRVTDGAGNPQEGVVVRFSFVAGAASQGTFPGVTGSVLEKVTDVNGEARTGWTLPGSGTTVNMGVSALGGSAPALTVTANVQQDDNLISPVIVEFGPAEGTVGINAGSPLFVKFNQKMDLASMNQHFSLKANAAPVAGVLRLEDLGRTVIFQPNAPLPFSAACVIDVTVGAKDQEGQTLATAGQSHFTIQAPPALVLTTLAPPAGPVGSAVTLNGTGFSPTTSSNTVLFNGTLGTVTVNNLTSLVAGVPLAATSGPVTVQVGTSLSNPLSFTVLAPDPQVGGTIGDINASPGIHDVAITPDGTRLYVTNPTSNTVSALDVETAALITNVTVGSMPQAVEILPDGSRAYVANTGSNNVSVIDINPQSANYHHVVKTIAVGSSPIDIAISPIGPTVYVLNQASGTLSVIDAQVGNTTFDQVTSTVNTGSGGTSIHITTDGSTAYVTNGSGFAVVDLKSKQVTSTVNLGSGGTGIHITTDGTLAFVLTANGNLVVVNLRPGPQQYQVVTTVNVGSGGTSIHVSTDGTLAYVTNGNGNVVFVFEITESGTGSSVILPVPKVTLTPVATLAVGQSPITLVFDPTGKKLGYVVNSGSGTLTRIGFASGRPPLEVVFGFNPNSLNLKAMGRWVTGKLTLPAPYGIADVDLSSIRVNGTVPVDPGSHQSGDDTVANGIATLGVKFLRSLVELAVATGDHVPVTVTGSFTDGRLFTGIDYIKVTRGRVNAPLANSVIAPINPYTVHWTTPSGATVKWVAFLHSFDHGNTWVLDRDHIVNSGSYVWQVPAVNVDSAKVAVVLVENDHLYGDSTATDSVRVDSLGVSPSGNSGNESVEGTLAVSDYFSIRGATSVEGVPLTLAFGRIQPNPASHEARMRYGVPRRTEVKLEVFDLQGRHLRTLAKGIREPGWYEARFDGRGDQGETLGPGLYFVRFEALGHQMRQRLVWLR